MSISRRVNILASAAVKFIPFAVCSWKITSWILIVVEAWFSVEIVFGLWVPDIPFWQIWIPTCRVSPFGTLRGKLQSLESWHKESDMRGHPLSEWLGSANMTCEHRAIMNGSWRSFDGEEEVHFDTVWDMAWNLWNEFLLECENIVDMCGIIGRPSSSTELQIQEVE